MTISIVYVMRERYPSLSHDPCPPGTSRQCATFLRTRNGDIQKQSVTSLISVISVGVCGISGILGNGKRDRCTV